MNLKKNQPVYASVAIIGMACLFPRSPGLKEYQRLLFRGEDAISEIPPTHWSIEDYFNPDPKKADHVYCKRGGFLDPVAFDPTEFGIPPAILDATDSSQLLALVTAKTALEDAGYGAGRAFDRDKVSVILGVTGTQELVIPLSSRLGHPLWRKAMRDAGVDGETAEEVVQRISAGYVEWKESSFPGLLGNVVAGRISNRLDLGGTNCVVDAACASSLSAVHLAVMELLTGRNDMVITGGVDTLNDIFMHMCFSKTSVLSATGDARPFSGDADGTVLGEGIGMVVLKRLEDAVNDNDRIYAVIRGIGSSSDGKSQSIYAPRPEGQVKAMKAAYDAAGVDPDTIELIEAHGTGTPVGDEVEFKALDQFFSQNAPGRNNVRALGSVKSMIGHTKAAAGSAGLIKSVLALYHKVLPPTLKVSSPDPNLNINKSSLYLNTETRPWFSSQGNHPRRAGVSAFGFGGSNFHAVLEEYKTEKNDISWDGSVEILAFSGLTSDALINTSSRAKTLIESAKSFSEIAAVAAETRAAFSHKDDYRLLMVIERSMWETTGATDFLHCFDDLLKSLAQTPGTPALDSKCMFYGGPEKPEKIAFLFPGQGAQYVGMGRDLICVFPQAFNVLVKADRIFGKDRRLSDMIYPVPVFDPKGKKTLEALLTETDNAQPAIGSISLAMLKILHYFGLSADATCGHSFGELTALNGAGWIDDDTLLNLAVHRGRLMAAAGKSGDRDPGTMMAVKAPLEELDQLIRNSDTGVILANRNTPTQGVLSGPSEAIAKAEKLCKDNKFKTIRLSVAAAFHSHLMKDAQKPFMDIVAGCRITPTNIPVYSNTLGLSYPTETAQAKKILGKQILCPVDFVNDIKNMVDFGVRTFVEVGPKTVLTGLVKAIVAAPDIVVIPVDESGGKQNGMLDLAKALSRLSAHGYPVLLKRWENSGGPAGSGKKPKMEVMISGANCRRTNQPLAGPGSSAVPYREKIRKTSPPCGAAEDFYAPQKSSAASPSMDFVSLALQTVQEGLKSMQSLQKQTAETHQKFLESQMESNKALRVMIESTQRLVESSIGVRSSANPTNFDIPVIPPTPEAIPAPRVAPMDIIDPILPAKRTQSSSLAQTITGNEIQSVLWATVSELTGYPEEMLGLDMDIEADLGIDSIKRVEILSAMEEKIPDLPQVQPEMMGTLKTLAQIIAHFSAGPSGSEKQNAVSHSSGKPVMANTGSVAAVLLSTVSELTGYPEEMLGLDMDIEADLGIDSIKRVEILSAMEEKIPDLPQVQPEMMGTLKTLNQIISFFSYPGPDKKTNRQMEDAAGSAVPDPEPPGNANRIVEPVPIVDAFSGIPRRIVLPASEPLIASPSISIHPQKKIYVLEDFYGLSSAVVAELISRDVPAVLFSADIRNDDNAFTDAAGLVLLPPEKPRSDELQWDPKQVSFLSTALMLAKKAGPVLTLSSGQEKTVFAAISRLDGAFGFKGGPVADPLMGALGGLVKTAAIEWPGVLCRAMDISPLWDDSPAMAKSIADELLNNPQGSSIEIGLAPRERFILKTIDSPYPDGELLISENDVVIVTGGARGITAKAVHALARQYKPILVLLGRSPAPFEEPLWLKGIINPADMKKTILRHAFSGKSVTPAILEKKYREFEANREIASNLDAIRSSGADAHYYSVDVCDEPNIASIINHIRQTHGPVSAIIHAAGVREDRLIIDKTEKQFQKVFETKVKGLCSLLEATRKDDLKYLVLFSSVAARMGNKGQSDYAMANESLNKIARHQAFTHPRCRVVSINWGPWDGGMVSPALKKEFSRNHIDLIPLEAGGECLVSEMRGGQSQAVEVLIGSPIVDKKDLPEHRHKKDFLTITPSPVNREPRFFPAFERNVTLEEYPILNSHRLNGIPVVPFALMAEWFAHGALHENPGLFLHGWEDMRVLNGIKLDQKPQRIRLFISKVRKEDAVWEVLLEIRNGIDENIIHSRAKALLTESPVQAPFFDPPGFFDSNGYSRSIVEIYDRILFHGDDLRGIKEISCLTDDGMVARILPAPAPKKWIKNPLRNKWVSDPLALDSAFQLASLWCFEKLGNVSLPIYGAGYRQYRDHFPDHPVTVVMEVTNATSHKIKADFTFLDNAHGVIAQLTGYEAVADETLRKAFKPQLEEFGPSRLSA